MAHPFSNLGLMPFNTDAGVGQRANIGMITLATDQTFEHEFNRLVQRAGIATYCTRIANDAQITPSTLQEMGGRIAGSVALLPPGVSFDVIAYGCTSASMLIGDDIVERRVRSVRPESKVTNPMLAAGVALRHLRVRRIALLTPYIEGISNAMRARLEEEGFQVTSMASFAQSDDNVVARIDQASIRNALLAVGRRHECEAVLMACTSLRILDVLEQTERELGKPITSSNHAIAWHALQLGGLLDGTGVGRLFQSASSS